MARKTLLAENGAKYIAAAPLYMGDMGNNEAVYDRPLDYKNSDYARQLALLAEYYNHAQSSWNNSNHDVMMIYCAMTSGREALATALQHPQRILQLSTVLDPLSDRPFITTQRIADALDNALIGSLAAHNAGRNLTTAALAETQFSNMRIIGPAHREFFLRSLQNMSSLTQGASFPDAVFEKHLWVPFCLSEATHGLYHGDHAWSRNACPEKATGLAIQYGSPVTMDARQERSFDVVDIRGRAISPLDQAHEDFRALIDFAERSVQISGQDYDVRNEALAALLLTRFAYHNAWVNGQDSVDKNYANTEIASFYKLKQPVKTLDAMTDFGHAYLKAKTSHWTGLQRIIAQDPALQAYWDNHVATAPDLSADDLTEKTQAILSYLPRGGLDNAADLNAHITRRRDAPSAALQQNMAAQPARAEGVLRDITSADFAPSLFNDKVLARLNGQDIFNPSHMNLAQASVITALSAGLSSGVASSGADRTYLYIDVPEIGAEADAFLTAHGNSRLWDVQAGFDPCQPSKNQQSFVHDVAPAIMQHHQTSCQALRTGGTATAWRTDQHVGNIVGISNLHAIIDHTATKRTSDEGLNAQYYEAFSAPGRVEDLTAPGASDNPKGAKTAIARLAIQLGMDGMILPKGPIHNDKVFTYIADGVSVALGLQPRLNNAQNGQFEFFEDHGAKHAPTKLDFLDLHNRVALACLDALLDDHPEKRPDLYRSAARMTHYYKLIANPAELNKHTLRDRFSGADKAQPVIDFSALRDRGFIQNLQNAAQRFDMPSLSLGRKPLTQPNEAHHDRHADANQFLQRAEIQDLLYGRLDVSEYQNDPVKQADLARMLNFILEDLPFQDPQNPRVDFPYTGLLPAVGAAFLDQDDLVDLHADYHHAQDYLSGLQSEQRVNRHHITAIHRDNVQPAFTPQR